ncbi:MAG: nucleotidyl transferase AbiEii/AbiGii toxin family protein [Myxococcota bacterium]
MIDFLHCLTDLLEPDGSGHMGMQPVLRGSILMRHWFGEQARQAHDIDLECFPAPWGSPEDGYRAYNGVYASLVDMGKAMCRYTAYDNSSTVTYWGYDDEGPIDGRVSLWTYGTPGERYYTAWNWNAEQLQGVLQLDLAEPGSYALDDIETCMITFPSPLAAYRVQDAELNGRPSGLRIPATAPSFTMRCYRQEMMLAAKLSWLLRGLVCRPGHTPQWSGEPKDLFDVHLLLTCGDLHPETFQKCMNAVCVDDTIHWSSLDGLLDVAQTPMPLDAFPRWGAFELGHAGRIEHGPWTLLCRIADRLAPLLGDLQLSKAEAEFVHNLHLPGTTAAYASWLSEHGARDKAKLLLQLEQLGTPSPQGGCLEARRQALVKALASPLRAWMLRLYPSTRAFRQATRERLGAVWFDPEARHFADDDEAIAWSLEQGAFTTREEALRWYGQGNSYAYLPMQRDRCWIACVESRLQALSYEQSPFDDTDIPF